MRKSYNSFIERQRVGYEMTATMIGYIVEKMKNANIISNEVSISGRIKSFKSAYENTGKKAVDDCFGIRIIGPMDDLRKIQAVIESEFTVDATKDHSRKVNSSYNAIHEMLHMKRKYASKSGVNYETFPEVEIQYWDEELREKCVYGELAYSKYKSKDLIDILNRLEKDRERVLLDLPVFYMIEGREITRISKQEALYKMYPEIEEIENYIKSTGFFRNKAKNIKKCSQQLLEKYNGEIPQDMDKLTELAGVGRKTANVVRGEVWGLADGITVDTHVKRITNLIGLVKSEDPIKIEQELMKIVPKKSWIVFSHYLILHGRATCIARRPQCENCEISECCNYGKIKLLKEN